MDNKLLVSLILSYFASYSVGFITILEGTKFGLWASAYRWVIFFFIDLTLFIYLSRKIKFKVKKKLIFNFRNFLLTLLTFTILIHIFTTIADAKLGPTRVELDDNTTLVSPNNYLIKINLLFILFWIIAPLIIGGFLKRWKIDDFNVYFDFFKFQLILIVCNVIITPILNILLLARYW
ncbi:MAG: hypothetical protein AABX00_06680 [Nanoarchaeota archaeon]